MRGSRAGGEVLGCQTRPPTQAEHLPVEVPAADWDVEFTEFVVECGADLSRTARLLCGDHHRAEELTQLALVRTYAAWGTARRGVPLAYARRVLAIARIDTWRTRRREVLTAPEALPEQQSPSAEPDHPRRDDAVAALHRLPVKRRRVVVLRYVLGLPEAEVADILGISVGAVKSAGSRGLAQLRADLQEADSRGGVTEEGKGR
ncbi:SigE family RNA polymerase sigma factor [Actinotalea sp. C106]|uniref:SigE family RNA polymerase sigma factor n=1 Tax=Actinotalea sp. C106 TaxID=2908644 RepID=UPI002028E8C5|nr:SigE family RNA polymerase sigma factor [Actinotalea sp. C106]